MSIPFRDRLVSTARYESQLTYSTQPDCRTVLCNECGTTDRWGCAECAEHWAEFHRTEFGHNVVVFPPLRDNSIYNRPRSGAQRRQWWER